MNEIDVLEQKAVDAAINRKWDDAIEFNKKIIDTDKNSMAAYLRLGFAYLQAKNITKAKTAYRQALKIQPKNPVAMENIERIKILEEKSSGGPDKDKEHTVLDPSIFLEAPGKTKTVAVVNLGQKNHIAQLVVGQEVLLLPKKRRIEVRTRSNVFIGSLPDDLSKRLIFFLKAKSKYRAYIKEATLTRIVIFIQEEKKGPTVANYTSFPTNIQSNLDQMGVKTGDEPHEHEENDDESLSDESEVESMANRLTEKEEDEEAYMDIHRDEEDDSEE